MFNLGFSEMLIIGVIVLIFIEPNEIPELARTVGRFLNEMRRASDGLKGDLSDNLRSVTRLDEVSSAPKSEFPAPAQEGSQAEELPKVEKPEGHS